VSRFSIKDLHKKSESMVSQDLIGSDALALGCEVSASERVTRIAQSFVHRKNRENPLVAFPSFSLVSNDRFLCSTILLV
jgi:hypothetical protein